MRILLQSCSSLTMFHVPRSPLRAVQLPEALVLPEVWLWVAAAADSVQSSPSVAGTLSVLEVESIQTACAPESPMRTTSMVAPTEMAIAATASTIPTTGRRVAGRSSVRRVRRNQSH